jgi:hypothetical protein
MIDFVRLSAVNRRPIGGYRVLTKHVRSECPLGVVLEPVLSEAKDQYFTPHLSVRMDATFRRTTWPKETIPSLGQLVSRLAGSA